MIDEFKIRQKMTQCRKDKGLTRKELAERMGVKERSLVGIEGGDMRLTLEWINKYMSFFPDLEIVTGNPIVDEKLGLVNIDSLVNIPQLDIQLSAGHGSYPQEHALNIKDRPFSREWLNKKGLNPKNLKLVRVNGDSMLPLLYDKDIVMIDTSKTIATEAMPFALRLEGDLLVKQLQYDNNYLKLVSRNKVYNDISINPKQPPDDFTILGAVVWHAHSWI